jgi:hypothetical protein
MVLKWLFVITELKVSGPNVIKALRYIGMILAISP